MSEDGVQTRETLELRDYLRVIKERFWVLPVTVLLVLAVVLTVSLLSTPQYQASARLLYQKNNLEQALFGSQVFSNSQQDRDVQTGALLVKLEPVAEAVKEELDSPRSSSSLLGMVSVSTKSGTNVVDITAVSDDPAESAAVANAFASQFVLFRKTADQATVKAARELVDQELRLLSRDELASDRGSQLKEKYDNLRIIEAMQDGGFTVAEQAAVPGEPFSPRTTRDAVLAAVLGLIAGLGLAFLLDYLDRGVKDDKGLEKALGAPVLARVPLLPGRRKGKARLKDSLEAVGFNRRPILLEAFRTLRSNLEFYAVEQRRSTWVITSSEPQEGKSTTAINLALSMALSGKRVVVVDADLRRPVMHEYLGIAQAPGLSNVLAGNKRLEEALQLVKADEFIPPAGRRRVGEEKAGLIQRNVYVIPSGPVPPNPAELIASPRMVKLMEELAGMCDCVVIDAPPVLAISDAVALARHADGVVVAVRLGATSRDQMYEVREIFERSRIRVLGAVAMGSEKSTSRRYGYGYGYGYGQRKQLESN